jgi:hypothetical protein
MKRLEVQSGALAPSAVASMREALMASALVGPSVLAGGFAATRGFAVLFRRDGVARLESLVPALAPFLAAVLPWPEASAYYLNLLVVPAGAQVEAHDDGTLTSACGLSRSAPVRVSVLYLQSPRRGGALRLHRLLGPATEVTPVEGTLVHFRGDLVHSVATVHEGLRISLVMEQYALDDAALARVPRCQLASEGHFDRVLAGARDRR